MKLSVALVVEAAPLVFTLTLTWEPSVSQRDIGCTLGAMRTQFDLDSVYGTQTNVVGHYDLQSMFCYYREHYVAFIYKHTMRKFVMFDSGQLVRCHRKMP